MAFDASRRFEAPRRRPYGARNDAEELLVGLMRDRIVSQGGVALALEFLGKWRKQSRRQSTERTFFFTKKEDTSLLLSFITEKIDLCKRAVASGDLGNPHTLGEWRAFISKLENEEQVILGGKK